MTDVVTREQAAAQELIGAEIQGLQVERLLGRGGMGEVYQAYDPHLDRRVAIKLVGELAAREESFVERFQREARVACRVQHPNVAQIFSAGAHQGRPFYVMEYVAGQSLGEVLEEKGALSGYRCLSYLIQTAEGLRAAQRQGIIHRDVKPANLMLDPDGKLKIVDFGLARSVVRDSTLTQTNAILGTPAYMAPEQALQTEVDHRADIYSLGATFYHLFAGQQPFRADTPVALVMKHAAEPLPPLKERNPRVPQAICAVIERMMVKDPAARYQTYDELIEELRRIESGQVSSQMTGATTALPPPMPQKAASGAALPLWRQPWVWLLLLLFVLTGGVVLRGPQGGEGAGAAGSAADGVERQRPGDAWLPAPDAATPPAGQDHGPAANEPSGDVDAWALQDDWTGGSGEVAEGSDAELGLRRARPQQQRPPLVTRRPGDGPRRAERTPPPRPEGNEGAWSERAERHAMMAMAKRAQTLAKLQQLHSAVQVYLATHGEPPVDLDSVAEAVGVPPQTLWDGWGEPVRYVNLGPGSVRLESAGPDGAFGTGDDIVLEDGYLVTESEP